MVYWPRDGGIVIRIKFKKGFEVYSLRAVTFVFYRELNSSSFILVRWVGGLGGWVAGLFKLITNSAQAEARAGAELGNTIPSKTIISFLRAGISKRYLLGNACGF